MSGLFSQSAGAQNSFLEINKTDNSVYRIELSGFNKITFSGTDMKINLKSGEINTIATTAIRTMIFKNSTGVNSAQSSSLKVYPNPAKENIRFSQLNSDNANIAVLSLTGQLLISQTLSSADESVSVKNLEPGIYFVMIENQLIRFVKQ
jgi:hypothetical protein